MTTLRLEGKIYNLTWEEGLTLLKTSAWMTGLTCGSHPSRVTRQLPTQANVQQVEA